LVWGSAFKEVRALTGTAAVQQDWVIAGRKNTADASSEHAEHSHQQHAEHERDHSVSTEIKQPASLNSIVIGAQLLQFSHPVLISPPSQKTPDWSVKSNAQNRPLRADAYFSATTGDLTNQQRFADRHVIDRAVGIGVAAHEGQLFGWFNQLLGLLTALGLVALSISGFVMWRKRAPNGVLGAPPSIPEAKIGVGFVVIILVAAVLLPVLGVSLIVIFLVERIVFAHWNRARVWLGLE
jgi:uncharacterized iron-regulated membrane protein